MATDKTNPRPNNKAVKLTDKAAAPVVETIAPVAAPIGTSVPPITPPAPESKAVAVLADEKQNSAALAVPATPTAAQLAARELQVTIGKAWVGFISAIPGAAGDFSEPNDDQIDEMIEQYMAANPGVKLTRAAFAVKDQIDQARVAHIAAQQNTNAIRREYYTAARAELLGFIATVDTLIVNAGGAPAKEKRAVSKADKVVTDSKASTTWADKAVKLYAWADAHGISDLILMDRTVGGYQGQYHSVKLHRDGRLEKVTVNDKREVTGTGEFVSKPIYFSNTDGTRPLYSVGQMFGFLLGDKKIDGINMSGVMSHLGDYSLILADADKK